MVIPGYAWLTSKWLQPRMAQISGYHYPSNWDLLGEEQEFDHIIAYLEIGWDQELLKRDMQNHPDAGGYGSVTYLRYTNLQVYRSCENTLKWMDDHGLLSEEAQEMIEKFGGPESVFVSIG